MMSTSPSDETEADSCSVESLPDSLLLHIFSYLVARDVLSCTQVCARWRAVAYDESLWKSLVYRQWNIGGSISPGHCSWRSEYKRLYYHAPLIWSETLTEHTDEVLHVSFAHNGSLFATTSKDCTVKIWQVGNPTSLKYSCDLGAKYQWNYSEFTSFNEDDTMLLASCVENTQTGWRGFLAVFSLQCNFCLLRVVSMNPPSLLGLWLNESTFVSGGLGRYPMDWFPNTVQLQVYEVKDDPDLERFTSTPTTEQDSGLVLFSFNTEAAHNVKFLVAAHVLCEESSAETNTTINHRKQRKLLFMTTDSDIVLYELSFTESSHKHISDILVSRTVDFSLSGHATGLRISRDHRYLFVNCRPFVDLPHKSEEPELSPNVEIVVVDLQDFTDTGIRYYGHKSSSTGYFIDLDSSDHYIGSGSEDSKAYLWDRHYQCCLGTFSHGPGVVNTVAFNPRDEECFVTVSDDHTIQIWRSRNRMASTHMTHDT